MYDYDDIAEIDEETNGENLRAFIHDTAALIKKLTPANKDWDDTEEWVDDAACLAHACMRLAELEKK